MKTGYFSADRLTKHDYDGGESRERHGESRQGVQISGSGQFHYFLLSDKHRALFSATRYGCIDFPTSRLRSTDAPVNCWCVTLRTGTETIISWVSARGQL